MRVLQAGTPPPQLTYDLPKGYVSPSQLETFLQCPQKWYQHYVLNIPSKESVYTWEGTRHHDVVETSLYLKALEGQHLGMADAHDMFTQRVEELQSEVQLWYRESPTTLISRAWEWYHRGWKQISLLEADSDSKGLVVEREMWLDLGGVSIKMVVDFVDSYGVNDIKCTRNPHDPTGALAMDLYCLAAGRPKARYIVFEKNKYGKAVDIKLSKSQPRDLTALRKYVSWQVQEIAKAMSQKICPPTCPKVNKLCSPIWCAAWDNCRGKIRRLSV